jgi:hypothetical protein
MRSTTPQVPPRPVNVSQSVHAELVARHLVLSMPTRERPVIAQERRFFRERRAQERRVELPGMAGVPGLDRRAGERRFVAERRGGRFDRTATHRV